MKRLLSVWMFVLAAGWAGALAAQTAALAPPTVKVTTVEDHDKAMKTIRANAIGVPKALESGALDDVRKRYVAIREQFVGVEGFWTAHKVDDVATLARTATAKVDAIIKAVDTTSRPAIDTAINEFVATCNACHAKYREPDPATPQSFVIKKGVL